MLRFLRALARGLTSPVRFARRRPLLAAAVAAVALAAAGLGGAAYARHQWRAAQDALAAGRAPEARSRLAVCLWVWPRDLQAHLLAARAARMCGDRQSAEDHLNRCLKLHGGATEEVQLEFLLLRAQTGDLDEVAPTLVDAVEKGHPQSPLILETLSHAYLRLLRYQRAYACLSRWMEICPDEPKAYQWRGWVLERLNQPKSAYEDYTRALAINPDLRVVRLRVAEMLLDDKRAPEAIPHLEQLYKQEPDNPEVQARLGMCRFYENRPAEARRLMAAAAVHMPKDAALLITLAKLDLQEGRAAEAEARLRQVLAADRSDSEAWYNLSSALQFQGRSSESALAMKEYQRSKEEVDRANKLLQEVADSPKATAKDYAEIGELLLRLGGRDRLGLYWLGKALERDPDCAPAHAALAAYYDKQGDAEKAAAHRRPPAAPSPDKSNRQAAR